MLKVDEQKPKMKEFANLVKEGVPGSNSGVNPNANGTRATVSRQASVASSYLVKGQSTDQNTRNDAMFPQYPSSQTVVSARDR